MTVLVGLDTYHREEHPSPVRRITGEIKIMMSATMEPRSEDYPKLLERVQKLEDENRRLKCFGTIVLVVIGALILMGQAGKNRALDADSLTIRDAVGNVRMELGTSEQNRSPILRMFGDSSHPTFATAELDSDQQGSELIFVGHSLARLTNTSDPMAVGLTSTSGPSLVVSDSSGGTSIEVASVQTYDNDKFNATLGRARTVDTKTGGKTQTSAASLTLFGKDEKVIWEAP